MFNCQACNKPIGPGISPIVVPTYKTIVHASGSPGEQIVRERKLCAPCAGVIPFPKPEQPKRETYLATIRGIAERLRKVLKGKDEDSREFKQSLGWFHSLPLQDLAEVTGDKLAPQGRFSVASLALDTWTDRTRDDSKRAKNDCGAGAFYLKGYEGRGGRL